METMSNKRFGARRTRTLKTMKSWFIPTQNFDLRIPPSGDPYSPSESQPRDKRLRRTRESA